MARILLYTEDDDTLRATQSILEAADHDVTAKSNWKEALKAATVQGFHVLIVVLQDKSGLSMTYSLLPCVNNILILSRDPHQWETASGRAMTRSTE